MDFVILFVISIIQGLMVAQHLIKYILVNDCFGCSGLATSFVLNNLSPLFCPFIVCFIVASLRAQSNTLIRMGSVG